ncbi:hypothetical protein J6590_054438 [Homalodisca vitripennis]|nr:hypothetical protein J6590_054438 [Homalodisca vitripennis]
MSVLYYVHNMTFGSRRLLQTKVCLVGVFGFHNTVSATSIWTPWVDLQSLNQISREQRLWTFVGHSLSDRVPVECDDLALVGRMTAISGGNAPQSHLPPYLISSPIKLVLAPNYPDANCPDWKRFKSRPRGLLLVGILHRGTLLDFGKLQL